MKAYRVKVSVRNNLLLNAIEKAGYKSVAEFERSAGIAIGRANCLVAMRDSPIQQTGEFSVEETITGQIVSNSKVINVK